MKRVAIFYINQDKDWQPDCHALVQDGFTCQVRVELTPPGTTLSHGLDMAKPRNGESVMNSHYVRAAK